MEISFEAAKKTEEDAQLIMEWRNDPITLSMSFHQNPKVWDQFWNEYCTTYFQDPKDPIFALYEERRVAFLRVKPYVLQENEEVVSIDINLSPKERSQGLGSKILNTLAKELISQGEKKIIAEIKKENKASIKAFEKAGFTSLDEIIKTVEDLNLKVPILRFIYT